MLKQWMLSHGADAQVVLFFGVYSLFLLAETRFPQRHTAAKRSSRWPTNLLLTGINIVVLSGLPISFFTVAVWAEANQIGLLNLVTLPMPLAIIINLLLRGFISFFTHWLMHTIPWFWRIHRVHHLDTELDVTSTVRFHPLEFLLTLIPGTTLVVILGLSPWLLLLYELLDASIAVFSHANVAVPHAIDRWLKFIIVTPNLHRIHHSSWQPETDSNFSAVFPIWDILFGTFRATSHAPQEVMELGLSEYRDFHAQQFFCLLRLPFLNA